MRASMHTLRPARRAQRAFLWLLKKNLDALTSSPMPSNVCPIIALGEARKRRVVRVLRSEIRFRMVLLSCSYARSLDRCSVMRFNAYYKIIKALNC